MFESVFDTIIKVTPLSSPHHSSRQRLSDRRLATPFSAPPSLALTNKVHQLATIKVLLAPEIDELVRRQRSLTTTGIFSTVGLSATYIPSQMAARSAQPFSISIVCSAASAGRGCRRAGSR